MRLGYLPPQSSRVQLFALSWRASLTPCEFYTMIFILSKTVLLGEIGHAFDFREFTADDSSDLDDRMAGTKITPVDFPQEDILKAVYSLEEKGLIEVDFHTEDIKYYHMYEDDAYRAMKGIAYMQVNLDALSKRPE